MMKPAIIDRLVPPHQSFQRAPFSLHLVLTAVAVLSVATVFAVARSRRGQRTWDGRASQCEERLYLLPSKETSAAVVAERPPHQTWDEVPPVVRRCLSRTFHPPSTATVMKEVHRPQQWEPEDAEEEPRPVGAVLSRSASFVQVGYVRLSGHWWAPYKARQTTTAQGFLWIAQISALGAVSNTRDVQTKRKASNHHENRSGSWSWNTCGLDWLMAQLHYYLDPLATLWICDAFARSEPSHAEVSWRRGAVTLLDSRHPIPSDPHSTSHDGFDATLWRGEAIRWLAELTVLPHLLLPKAGIVVWREATNHADAQPPNTPPTTTKQAILELPVSSSDAFASQLPIQLVATFDASTGLLRQLHGTRPRLTGRDKAFVALTWVACFGEYRWSPMAQCWHPSEMEAGWIDGDLDDSVDGKVDDWEGKLVVAVRARQLDVQYDLGPSRFAE